jgi:hypothetical protein
MNVDNRVIGGDSVGSMTERLRSHIEDQIKLSQST